MYPTDFEAKTSHLTLAEDGAYNRLLRLMWMTPGCTLPADHAWLMRRLRVDQETFDAVVKVVLDEFFTVKSGRLSNAKLTRVFDASSEAHQKRVSAGAKGGNAKSLKTLAAVSSNAKAMPKQPEPEPEPLREIDKSISCPFVDFWNVWPAKLSKQQAEKAWRKLTPADRKAAYEAAKGGWFARWQSAHPDANPIHPASYLNGKRWEDVIQGKANSGPAPKAGGEHAGAFGFIRERG
jgi:uncharacterized protein YdaU (DUF1376 family)